jgi:hypothetical protein
VEVNTPSWRDLKGAISPEAVDLLQAADQNPSVFKGKLGIVNPPLVLTSILESDTMIPVSLIPILSNKFQEFDRTSPTVKACTLLRPVLQYLWAVHKNLIQPTVFSIDQCTESQNWASRLHLANTNQLLIQWHHLLFHYLLLLKLQLKTCWPWM